MTDRWKGVTVAFDRDICEDDAEAIVQAIRLIKGVASVASLVANVDDWTARQQIRVELAHAIQDLVDKVLARSPHGGPS